MDRIIDNLHTVGPMFAGVWILTIALTLWKPQRFRNSLLLMFSMVVTLVFIAGFFGHEARQNMLLACFLLVMLGLFLVPVLLIINGIQMIRRESFSMAHILSLVLGIIVGIGEICAVIYVFEIADILVLEKVNRWLLFIAFTVFYFSFLVLCFVVYSIFIQLMPHRMNFNYIIIHGCSLADGERLTKLLANRVDKAIEIYRKGKGKPIIIPSGGRGSDEKLSEAQAMKNYLLDHQIPEESIVLEEDSKTTWENLVNSKKIIDSRPGRKKTALVSSNYHIYRCLRYARDAGLSCTGIGAKVALYFWPSALIREFIAVFLTKGFLIRALIGYVLFIGPILYVFLLS